MYRRTRDRDYEDITEKPEITLAALARKEEEEMRRERRAKEVSEYRSAGASQLYARRPSMSAEYLAGRDDEEYDGDNLAALKRTDYEKKPKPSSALKRKYYEEEEEEEEDQMEVCAAVYDIPCCSLLLHSDTGEMLQIIDDGFEKDDEVVGIGRSWEQSSSKKAKGRDDTSIVRATTEVKVVPVEKDSKTSKVKKLLKGVEETMPTSAGDRGSDDDNDLIVQRKRLSRAIIDSDDDEV